MQEKQEENSAVIRFPLDEKTKQNCRDTLEELFELYEQTDPTGGKFTEEQKHRKAIDALMKAGIISKSLTEWAEDHILGLYYKKGKLNIWDVPENMRNSHENELLPYSKDVFAHAECSCEICPQCFSAVLQNRREAISAILAYISGGDIAGWRQLTIDAFNSLNHGQVKWLATPIKTNKQGKSFDAMKLRRAAVMYLYKLMGEGYPKYVAREEILDKEYDINSEAVKKWEQQFIKDGILIKRNLEKLRKASAFLYKNPSIDTYDIRVSAYHIMSSSSNSEYAQLSVYFSQFLKNLESEIECTEVQLTEDIAWGIITLHSLEYDYPLEDLKERLIDTEMPMR